MKKLTSTLLAFALCLPWSSSYAIDIRYNGEKIAMEVPPALQNNRTMISISAVANALGGDAQWKPDTREVVVQRNGSTIQLKIDSSPAMVNDSTVSLDAPPVIFKGRTMVPLSFLATAFGEKVRWDSNTQTVFIGSGITDPQEIQLHPATQALNNFMGSYKLHNLDPSFLGIDPADVKFLATTQGLDEAQSSALMNQLSNIAYKIVSITQKDSSYDLQIQAEFNDLGKVFYDSALASQNEFLQWASLDDGQRESLLSKMKNLSLSSVSSSKKVYADVKVSVLSKDGQYLIDLKNSPAFCNILWGNILSYK